MFCVRLLLLPVVSFHVFLQLMDLLLDFSRGLRLDGLFITFFRSFLLVLLQFFLTRLSVMLLHRVEMSVASHGEDYFLQVC